MRKLFLVLTAAMLAPGAVSQGAFEGTWKIDWSQTTVTAKPSQQVLKDGKLTCDPCDGGAWSVPADGADHPVSGIKGFDSVAIQVVNESEVRETQRKDGKVVWSGDIRLLPDGKTRAVSWPENDKDGNPVRTVSVEDTRIAPAPAGAHALSGTWVLSKVPPLSDDDMIVIYKVEGDQLIYSNAKKVVYRAKIDGPDVRLEGESPDSTVAVKRIDADTVEETYKKGSEVTFVSRMTVRKDGKAIEATNSDPNGMVMKLVALKQ